jgi:hypothetical protein
MVPREMNEKRRLFKEEQQRKKAAKPASHGKTWQLEQFGIWNSHEPTG